MGLASLWPDSDGLSDEQRNCGCGQGVKVLVDPYHAKCGACNAISLTQLGLNKKYEKEREEMLRKMQEERDAYNAEHPGEI
jgi:hypothetical protein